MALDIEASSLRIIWEQTKQKTVSFTQKKQEERNVWTQAKRIFEGKQGFQSI